MTDLKLGLRTLDADGTPINPPTEETQSAIAAKLPTLGQKNSAGSVAVVLASDQPTVGTSDSRHETHVAVQPVVTVTTSPQTLAALLTTAIPAWATACRLYVGSASGIVYSTDGVDPAYTAPDATHGVPLDAYDRTGHLIPGVASIAALRLVAMTASVKVSIELMG